MTKRVALIGAGMAGAACFSHLQQAGVSVDVFEKSRGLGGRLSNRRAEWQGQPFQFDHGAQFFNAKETSFYAYLREAEQAGYVGSWHPKGDHSGKDRWTGVPTMSRAVGGLIARSQVSFQSKILSLKKESKAWFLEVEGHTKRKGPYDIVISSAPAPQTYAVFKKHSEIFQKLNEVKFEPCWSVMVAFEETVPGGDLYDRKHHGLKQEVISWAGRDVSKRGRPKSLDTWVIHASSEWSQKNFELEKKQAESQLIEAFCCLTSQNQEPIHLSSHRWRYAKVSKALGADFLEDSSQGLYAIGDWCLGPRVECAYQSGIACAYSLLESILP